MSSSIVLKRQSYTEQMRRRLGLDNVIVYIICIKNIAAIVRCSGHQQMVLRKFAYW